MQERAASGRPRLPEYRCPINKRAKQCIWDGKPLPGEIDDQFIEQHPSYRARFVAREITLSVVKAAAHVLALWLTMASAWCGTVEPSPYRSLLAHCKGLDSSFGCARAIEAAQAKGAVRKRFSARTIRCECRLLKGWCILLTTIQRVMTRSITTILLGSLRYSCTFSICSIGREMHIWRFTISLV
jgi:hypothetical protein